MFDTTQLITIIGATVLITFAVCWKESSYNRLIYIIISSTVFLYSGLGIAYQNVSFRYFIYYLLFLLPLLCTVKMVFRPKVRFASARSQEDEWDFDCNSRAVTVMTVLFFLSVSAYLFFPTFQPWKLFRPTAPISTYIYEQRAAMRSNPILKLSETLSTGSLPFFCMFLKRLIDKHKKPTAVLMVLLWAYIDYVQYNYMGRYQMVVYAAFVYFICAFVYPDGIRVEKKYVLPLVIGSLVTVPFLAAYTYIRKGTFVEFLSVKEALSVLIESECGYPLRYSICESLQGSSGFINFLLWLIFLPIPSFLFVFTKKPTLTVAHEFTYAVSGRIFGAANYSSNLPSVLGEGMLIWGLNWIWLHGIVIGFIIAINMKFIRRHKSLIVLYVYLLLLMTTLGRGGAQSYMSSIINGTVFVMVWWWIVNHVRIGEKSLKSNIQR